MVGQPRLRQEARLAALKPPSTPLNSPPTPRGGEFTASPKLRAHPSVAGAEGGPVRRSAGVAHSRRHAHRHRTPATCPQIRPCVRHHRRRADGSTGTGPAAEGSASDGHRVGNSLDVHSRDSGSACRRAHLRDHGVEQPTGCRPVTSAHRLGGDDGRLRRRGEPRRVRGDVVELPNGLVLCGSEQPSLPPGIGGQLGRNSSPTFMGPEALKD